MPARVHRLSDRQLDTIKAKDKDKDKDHVSAMARTFNDRASLSKISAPMVIELLRPVEAKECLETVKGLRRHLDEIMTYGLLKIFCGFRADAIAAFVGKGQLNTLKLTRARVHLHAPKLADGRESGDNSRKFQQQIPAVITLTQPPAPHLLQS